MDLGLKHEVYKLYHERLKQEKDVAGDEPVARRDWTTLLSKIIPSEIFCNPDTTALFTSYFLGQQRFDNNNRLNGIVQYLLNESTELLQAAIVLSAFMASTKDTNNANPFRYNPMQFVEELGVYMQTAGDRANEEWTEANKKQAAARKEKFSD